MIKLQYVNFFYLKKIFLIKKNFDKQFFFIKLDKQFFFIKINLNFIYNILILKSKIEFLNFKLLSLDYFFFKKILFYCQNFKLVKKNINFFIKLNSSTLIFLYLQSLLIKKIKKQKIIIFVKIFKLLKFIKNIVNLNNLNIFTKKGVRLSKNIILKKKIK